jgi:DNA-binding NarL/FixJ family response regulator
MKDILIAILLAVVMTLNFIDVLVDINLGVPSWHIFEEALLVLLSAIGTVYLVREIRFKSRQISHLKTELQTTSDRFENISEEMKQARKEYGEVISSQFNNWNLTQSEQEVAMLLLKGLSFKEISAVRDTKEKTVRQQASSIYEKASVEGRHEFAAWFFEDFIAPQTKIS